MNQKLWSRKYSTLTQMLCASLLICVLCLILSIFRVIVTGNTRYLFMIINLGLAVIPLNITVLLYKIPKKSRSSRILTILGLIVWLLFLPNSFYMLTDFIHLNPLLAVTGEYMAGNYNLDIETPEISFLYDIVLIFMYVIAGYIVGMLSVALMHLKLKKYLGYSHSNMAVMAIFLLTGFAIYLGRFLRWNSWDILRDPAGLIFDISERIVNPLSHLRTFSTTLLFFCLNTALYFVGWWFIRLARQSNLK